MKKALSLILAVMMLLGCMSITAFADGKTMITEVNLTVGKTYTDLDTGVSVSVPGEADYTASYGGMEFVVGSDVYFYQITGGDSNLWLNMKSYTPCQTPPDVSNADKVFAVINLYTKDWQTYAFAENAGLTVTCNGRTINQKAQAASEEGWFSVGGISYQVLIDITPFKTSGNTDITLTVAKALTYDMVIPEDVTNLNAAGIYSVGQAKVANVKNATEKTVISYTAETTAFKCEGKTDIPASYYTDAQGTTAFPTTAVEVYKNGADAENIPTMYVGISADAWNAAENGTYTATVTFNFEVKKNAEKLEDVLKTISLPSASDFSGDDSVALADAITKSFINDNFESVIMYGDFDDDNKDELACILLGGNGNLTCELDNKVTKTANGYSLTENGITWDFAMNDDKVESITISGSDKANMNGVHKKRIRLEDVLPDDFPKKTGENEPNNAWIEQNNNNQKLYIENVAGVDALHIGNTSKALMLYVGDKTGNNYEFKSFNNLTYTITLTMTDAGKLESITVSGFGDGKNGTYKAPVPVTVADLLATVKNGLPTRWQESNWLNDKVIACLYKNSNTLTAYSNDKTATVSTSTVLTQNGNNYTYSDGTNTWSFIMEGETLTQITYSGTDDTAVLNGTYKILTIADLLATVEGFPTTYDSSRWMNNKRSRLYKDGDVLKAYNQGESQTLTVPCNTVLTMEPLFGDAYGGQYNEGLMTYDWLFYMNDNKLTKVKYQYINITTAELFGDYAVPQPK